MDLALSPGRETISFVDAKTGQPVLGPTQWHTAPVKSVKFSPDGFRVASGLDDVTSITKQEGRNFIYPCRQPEAIGDWTQMGGQ
ncbi:unnamed protein product [Rhizoctonia solani]|uniref:Anaphase-promoting complex subunit 4 WD40 domain-containing protein n=1 Tax=Rhizoctonia solani TaxID=456999 RepID=A0A8H3B9B0_9AGAM|nr:unnamed protein product [Rhizoctonia solani]